jgi:hypothetical protein
MQSLNSAALFLKIHCVVDSRKSSCQPEAMWNQFTKAEQKAEKGKKVEKRGKMKNRGEAKKGSGPMFNEKEGNKKQKFRQYRPLIFQKHVHSLFSECGP